MTHSYPNLLPLSYPSECIETVILRDGTPVTLRPIRPDDAPRLQEGFARLSPQTIYLRFLQTFKELTDEQARQFATVDYQHRMALVGSILEEGVERLIAVARYSMVGESQPGIAEAGIVVRDDYQNRGLGTIALERLVSYGRLHGVTGLLATTHMSNTRIMHFVQRSGLPFEKRMLEPGTWEILVRLEAVDETA